MWTVENRCHYDRSKLRYPTDLTDAEWALVEPLIPPAKRGGNKRTVNMREVVNGLMYILGTGEAAKGSVHAVRGKTAEGANGLPCQRTCPRAARCITTLPAGTGTVR